MKKIIKATGNLSLSLYIISLFILSYDTNLNKISKVLFLFFSFCVILYIAVKKRVIKSPMYIFLYLYLSLSLVSYFWGVNKAIIVQYNTTLIQLIIFAVLVVNFIDDKESIRICIKSILFGVIFMCLYSIYYYGLSQIKESLVMGTRLGGEINQENDFGLYCVIGFIICIYYAVYEKKKFYYILSFLPLVFTFASGSRMAIINIVVGTIFLLAFRSNTKKIYNVIISIIIISIVIYILYSSGLFINSFERIDKLINLLNGRGETDNSLLTRQQMLYFGWNLFLKRPILGYGAFQYNEYYFNCFGIYRPSHNNYIEILVSFGITGFIIFYGMYAYILHKLLKLKKYSNSANIILLINIIYILNGLSTNLSYNKFTYLFLSIAYALYRTYENKYINKKVERKQICAEFAGF